MSMKVESVVHPFEPVYNPNCKVLLLGSFPSPKSRENGFYFGHKQNRFWRVLAAIFNENEPNSIEEKTAFLLSHHIALWDVVKTCKIVGASDSSIKDVEVNDFNLILKTANIKQIFTLGKTATNLLKKYGNLQSICLPSTSPANCVLSFNALCGEYKIILKFLK